MREIAAETIQRIHEEARALEGAQLEALRKFVSIDSGTGHEAGNARVVEILEGLLAAVGATCERVYVPGTGTHVIARITPERATGRLVVSAHLDTVFEVGCAHEHPFRCEGNKAYGLGIADCKGGVVVSLFAVKIAQKLGLMPPKEIVFAYTSDEEKGSPTARELFKEVASGAEAVFGFEPARGKSGVLTFRPGYATAKVRVFGKKAHAFNGYGDGVSGPYVLARLITELIAHNDDARHIQYTWLDLKSPADLGSVVDYAEARLLVPVFDGAYLADIRRDVCEMLPQVGAALGARVEVALDESQAGTMCRTEGTRELAGRVTACGKALGLDVPEEAAFAPSDLNIYASLGVPTVDGLGPYMHDIHTLNECVEIPSLAEKAALFATVLASYA